MTPSPTSGIRRWRGPLLAAPSLLFVLALAGAEAGVRALLPHLPPLEVFVRDPHQRMGFTDRREVRIFRFDPELFWRLQPDLRDVIWDFTLVSTNAQGLRHPRDLDPKPAGGFRIVCVGDSVTFGYRVPVIWAERPQAYDRDALPYPALLEAHLRRLNPDRDVEAIALAAPGYSSYQGRLWLAREIDRLRPDLVTTLFGWNDVNVRRATDAQTMPAESWRVAMRRLVASSQGLLHVTERLRAAESGAQPEGGPTTLRVTRDEFVANHLEMQRLTVESGARFAAIGTVFRDALGDPEETSRLAGHRAALREALGGRGIPYLEVAELTEAGHPANEILFGEAIHPNALGHRLLAGRLLVFLEREGLLGNLNGPLLGGNAGSGE